MKIESNTIRELIAAGKPFLVAQYVTGKVSLGQRVNKETGKTEPYGSILHGLVIDAEVVKIQERLDPDRLNTALSLCKPGPDGKPALDSIPRDVQERFIGVKAGESCCVRVTTYVWEEGARNRMSLRISGVILPL